MKKEIFGIPIFEDKVDVTKFDIIPPAPLEPTWDSGVPSTFSSQKQELIPEDIWRYLSEVIERNLYPANLMGKNARFGHIWKNVYEKHHYQDAHIHPKSQWSFVIYVDVTSRTAFFNPSIHNIQNHIGCTNPYFPLDYKPNLEPGSIIIFPSFLMHMVNSGNEGSTISGNLYMEYP